MLQKLKDLRQVKHKEKNLKETAMELKGAVNSIIWDYSLPLNTVEFKTLYNLVYYIDQFILNCFDEKGKLIHKKWIQKKLIASVVFLGSSSHIELQRVMRLVIDLENKIYLEEVPTQNEGN